MGFLVERRRDLGEFGCKDGSEECGAHDVVVGRCVEVGVDEGVGREGGWGGGDVDVVGKSWKVRNIGRHSIRR